MHYLPFPSYFMPFLSYFISLKLPPDPFFFAQPLIIMYFLITIERRWLLTMKFLSSISQKPGIRFWFINSSFIYTFYLLGLIMIVIKTLVLNEGRWWWSFHLPKTNNLSNNVLTVRILRFHAVKSYSIKRSTSWKLSSE